MSSIEDLQSISKIRVYLNRSLSDSQHGDEEFFIWDLDDLWALRAKYRIVGRLIGTYAEHSAQNKYNALPLLLMAEELSLMANLNCVDLYSLDRHSVASIDAALPVTMEFRRRATIFSDLWHRGFYLTSGSKFGTHFMAYPGDPVRFHASYIILIVEETQPIHFLDLVSLARLAVGVKKSAIIATTLQDSKTNLFTPRYLSLEWLGVT